jgi:hypothetical protein
MMPMPARKAKRITASHPTVDRGRDVGRSGRVW